MKKKLIILGVLLVLVALAFAPLRLGWLILTYDNVFADSTQSDTTVTDVEGGVGADGRPATLLSAFYGIDDGLPGVLRFLFCSEAPGKDGMPVIFSHEIDPASLQAGDFEVTRASGKKTTPVCVTLAPADDPGEHRTVLLAGDFGNAEDQPVRVELVGSILTREGRANFKGQTVDVIPLEAGPTIVFAEELPREAWRMGEHADALPWGGGSGAAPGSTCVVRAVWAGGVTKPGREEIGEDVRAGYRVTMRLASGETVDVVPFAIGDLGDGDNNHLLCLDVEGTPLAVELAADLVVDPRGDWNPRTRVPITTKAE